MANQKNTMETMPKRTICMTGTPILSLRVGERARIQTAHQDILTSTVLHILEASAAGVVFETRNSIYRLDYGMIPANTVLCA